MRCPAGRIPQRRSTFRLLRARSPPGPESAPRHPGAGAGGLHQRPRPRRTVRLGGDRDLRHPGVDQFARAAGDAGRPGDRVQRRRTGQLGRPRGGVPGGRHRRHVRPAHRRAGGAGRRRHRLGGHHAGAVVGGAARGPRRGEQPHRGAEWRGAAHRLLRLGCRAAGCHGDDRRDPAVDVCRTGRRSFGRGLGVADRRHHAGGHRGRARPQGRRTDHRAAGHPGRRRRLPADRRRPAGRPHRKDSGDRRRPDGAVLRRPDTVVEAVTDRDGGDADRAPRRRAVRPRRHRSARAGLRAVHLRFHGRAQGRRGHP